MNNDHEKGGPQVSAVAEQCFRPESVDAVSQWVREQPRIQIVGASTKPAMATSNPDVARLVMTGLSGVVDHQPSEFLITALAGTSIQEMQSALASHQQYLPFDPPFAARGATIGGTVAAGLSGAGRLRFGGLRDFIVGVRIVDGLGSQITGGGRVVKNAAGYDLPKLMVGSGGLLGAIVEVTLKVFPKPTHSKTICLKASSIQSAASLQNSLARSPIDVAAIDLTPDGSLWQLGHCAFRPAASSGSDNVALQVGQGNCKVRSWENGRRSSPLQWQACPI